MHIRSDERAPVWGSEFTTKAATFQGGVEDSPPRLNIKFVDMVTAYSVPARCVASSHKYLLKIKNVCEHSEKARAPHTSEKAR